ncbi:MAG: tRNA isopentenyl-2-thiomethyl-A-37 hydroxylase MiaE [Halioglobus sp.]
MTPKTDIAPILAFLSCETPAAWVDWALLHPDIMLIDHANCEKKAAATALNLMYRYAGNHTLLNKMSRLAREELRHFEQVIAIMHERGIDYPQISASRYAGGLRKSMRNTEPGRMVDTLLVGAIIEARSCERFARLVPVLDDDLALFYASLLKSESRHFKDYLQLAKEASSAQEVEERLEVLLEAERALIQEADSEFRFHSGPPEKLDVKP